MLLKNSVKYGLLIVLVGLLIAVRAFEEILFYDPFISYFKTEFFNLPYPKMHIGKLFLSLGFRYGINSLLSVAIIYVLFKDVSKVKFASILLGIFFLVLALLMLFLLFFLTEKHAMTLFYVRRFLIQPVFLLLFIPAFYYQQKNHK